MFPIYGSDSTVFGALNSCAGISMSETDNRASVLKLWTSLCCMCFVTPNSSSFVVSFCLFAIVVVVCRSQNFVRMQSRVSCRFDGG